jgi:4,5-DOPA dioxygenase extradiol
LLVSAHWDNATPCLGATSQPETLHDYWGFPDELYDIVYPVPGAPQLAVAAKGLLDAGGFPAELNSRRGLDHAAWIPLRIMYPEADVPVATLSVQGALGPRHHYSVGRALAALSQQNVVIIGSGNITHNLSHFRGGGVDLAYVAQFQDWFYQQLVKRDIEALFCYRELAPGGIEAHPTEEHLMPLFVALGACDEGFTTERLYDGIYHSMLAMDSYAFQNQGSRQVA